MKEKTNETNGYTELYRKHRPSTLDGVVGQQGVIDALQALIGAGKIPHVLLFVGPSGTGKTTCARILKNTLNCGDVDFEEVDCAALESPIQKVRDIKQRMGLAPISGETRVWVLNEIQSLSRAGFAQQSLLGILEDTPDHVYFVLTTTDATKLHQAVLTRCERFDLVAVDNNALEGLLGQVAKKEKCTLPKSVVSKIVECANGSPRMALVLLHKVIGLDNEETQLKSIQPANSEHKAIEIARALMNKRTRWADLALLLKEVNEDPEAIRRMVLGYATSVLLNKSSSWAYMIICAFESNFYDTAPGKAGLMRACYEVLENRDK